MGEAGFEGIRKSETRRQNTVAKYIATRTILDLCEQSTWRPGARVSRWWWEQDCIDLEGGEEEGDGGSNSIGVGVGLGIERGPWRRGGV